MNAADIEIDKMAGRASGRTTSASHTTEDGRFGLNQKIPDHFVISVVIDLTVRTYCVAEGFQG